MLQLTRTPGLTKELIKIVQKTSKTEDGQFFRALVAVLWPVLADLYQDRISNPIDLCTIQMKLKDLSYPNITAFEDDIRLIADNAVEFNGPNHVVTTASCAVRDKILEQMDDVRPIADTRARFQNIGQLGTENKDANAPEKTSAISEIVPLDNVCGGFLIPGLLYLLTKAGPTYLDSPRYSSKGHSTDY